MSQSLKPTITRDGQAYVDEPIIVNPKPGTLLASSIAHAFGQSARPQPIVTGHERVRLRWLTGDGKGGLKPREGQ